MLKSQEMCSLLKKLHRIPEQSKLGVYGWIRQADEQLNSSQQMPLMICNICILYYFDQDIFDTRAYGVGRSKDYKYIAALNKAQYWGGKCNAFGLTEIDSMSDNKYRWDINLEQINHKCVVGIISTKNTQNSKAILNVNYKIWDVWEKNTLRSYDWIAYGGKFENQSNGISDKTVSMHLDLKEKTIRWKGDNANMHSKEIVYDKEIETGPDIKYRLAVTMYAKYDCFKIENFTQIFDDSK